MEVHILDQQNTVLNRFIAEMRDVKIQTDSMRFRRNLERAGEIMAYEISKTFVYTKQTVETPLGEAQVALSDDQIVIATILRAGIPYHQGFLNYFDGASNAFVSAFRKYSKDNSFKVKVEYVSSVDLADKTLVLVDPMLATGTSTVLTYKTLLEKGGNPGHTHIASIIASDEGVEYVKANLPEKEVTIWCGSVDEELTVKSYIVPGLGDAGDLAYGDKL
jgi:uracil phosphoribosyltransferase